MAQILSMLYCSEKFALDMRFVAVICVQVVRLAVKSSASRDVYTS